MKSLTLPKFIPLDKTTMSVLYYLTDCIPSGSVVLACIQNANNLISIWSKAVEDYPESFKIEKEFEDIKDDLVLLKKLVSEFNEQKFFENLYQHNWYFRRHVEIYWEVFGIDLYGLRSK
jgi:hypothetical protein